MENDFEELENILEASFYIKLKTKLEFLRNEGYFLKSEN